MKISFAKMGVFADTIHVSRRRKVDNFSGDFCDFKVFALL
jgi:hypothetical protein